MTSGLIGRKLGMTQMFTEDGTAVPVTVIEAGPCRVVQVREGGVQLGFGARRKQRTTRAELGHAKKAGLEVAPQVLRVFAGERRRAGTRRRGEGGHLRGGRAGQGDRHDEGPRIPGRGQAARVRRRARTRTATRSTGSRARSAPAPTRRASSRARRCRGTSAPSATPSSASRVEGRRRAQSDLRPRRRPGRQERHRHRARSREGPAAMIEAPHYTQAGAKRNASFALPAEYFDGTVNVPVMHQAVKAFLANQRQGNASTKIRELRHRRQPEAVEAEGHRPRAAGLDPGAALAGRRHRVRAAPARAIAPRSRGR